MARLYVNIPDDLEDAFRNAIYKAKGYKKGNISEAVEEAIRLWLDQNGPT